MPSFSLHKPNHTGFTNNNSSSFSGGNLNFELTDLLSKGDQHSSATAMDINIILLNSIKKESKKNEFNPMSTFVLSTLFKKKFNLFKQNLMMILPTHLYYSQEFCVNDLSGKKKMQKHSQIFLLSHVQKLKSISILFETIYQLLYFRQDVIGSVESLLLVSDLKNIKNN